MSLLDYSQLEIYPSEMLALTFWEASDSDAERIVEILVERGAEAVPSLIKALEEGDSNIRYYAVYTLKRIGDRRAVVPISNLLADKNDNVRILAALYLPTFGDLDLDLCKHYLVSSDWKMRSSAAIMLGQSPDDRAIDMLLPLLRDENKRVSFDALWSLDKLVNSQASLPVKEKVLPALVEATKDADTTTRCMAAEILGNLGDGRAVEVLTGLKENDPDSYVRDAAAKALENLG